MTHLDARERQLSVDASRPRLVPALVWRRLPWFAEIGVLVLGYLAYSRVRVAAPASESVAFFHSKQVWDLERLLHIDIELIVNRIVSFGSILADASGYYYGTLHFIVTPAVLVWLYMRRPDSYARLRSAIVITSVLALAVFWTWPLAPPRFALGGVVDVLAQHNILGAANPHGVSNLVNLYAAMPSLHVAWAAWCALAVYTTTTGRWRRMVWIYPAATTFVVLGTANHYLLDGVAGVAALAFALYLTRPSATVVLRDTQPADAEVLDRGVGDGSIVDIRRPSRPSPPQDR